VSELRGGMGTLADTVHLAAQVIRHHRALLTSLEKWIGKQEPDPALRELLRVIAQSRRAVTDIETRISQMSVEDETVRI